MRVSRKGERKKEKRERKRERRIAKKRKEKERISETHDLRSVEILSSSRAEIGGRVLKVPITVAELPPATTTKLYKRRKENLSYEVKYLRPCLHIICPLFHISSPP